MIPLLSRPQTFRKKTGRPFSIDRISRNINRIINKIFDRWFLTFDSRIGIRNEEKVILVICHFSSNGCMLWTERPWKTHRAALPFARRSMHHIKHRNAKNQLRVWLRQRKFMRIILNEFHFIQNGIDGKTFLSILKQKRNRTKKKRVRKKVISPAKGRREKLLKKKKTYLKGSSGTSTSLVHSALPCMRTHSSREPDATSGGRSGKWETEKSSWDLRIKKNKNVIHLMCFHFEIFFIYFLAVYLLCCRLHCMAWHRRMNSEPRICMKNEEPDRANI